MSDDIYFMMDEYKDNCNKSKMLIFNGQIIAQTGKFKDVYTLI